MSAAKVYRIDNSQILALVSGKARIRNLPKDAQIIAAVPCHDRNGPCLGLRVHSSTFPLKPYGVPLTIVPAVLEKIEGDTCDA